MAPVVVVGASTSEASTDTVLRVVPNRTFDQVHDPRVVVVPGGFLAGIVACVVGLKVLH